MKKSTCVKTMTGKHSFVKKQFRYKDKENNNSIMGTPRYILICKYCGIIDDRK